MTNFWKTLSKPIIGLAPMDGVTDEPMRQIQCLIAKPDILYTEFIAVEGFIRKPAIFKKKLDYTEDERPIIAQIFGIDPIAFYWAVKNIIKMGFDGVDINMGCPNKDVVKRGAGGGLIGNYSLSEKIINECLKAIEESDKKIPLSVKTRIAENQKSTEKWIIFLASFPLSEVTIHGRILSAGLSGPVDWDQIGESSKIVKKNKIVCLGNGGIKSIDEAKNLCRKYELDGVLIGQGALGNPWIFKNYIPTRQEKLELILKHSNLVWEYFGEKGYTTVLKHIAWYCMGFDNAKSLKAELMRTRSYQETESVIKSFISSHP